MIVTREDMQKTGIADAFRRFLSNNGYGPQYLRGNGRQTVRVSNATADQLFDEYRANNIKGEYYKGIRPWDLINFRDQYPDADVMIGVEVECGFTSRRRLTTAYTYLMDKCTYATADTEGYDEFPLEATFPPVPADQLLQEGCQLRGFYKNVLGKQPELWDSEDMIGTHFNVSFRGVPPAGINLRMNSLNRVFLDQDYDVYDDDDDYCCEDCDGDYDTWLSNREEARDTVRSLSVEECRVLFGRVPYGGLYFNRAYDAATWWVEMKLFDSTTNLAKLAWYKEVAMTIVGLLREDNADNALEVMCALAARSPLDKYGNMPKVKVAKQSRKIKEKALAVAG